MLADEFGSGGLPPGRRRSAARAPYVAGAFAAGALVWGDVSLPPAEVPGEASPAAGAIVLGAYLAAGSLTAAGARVRSLLAAGTILSALAFPLIGTASAVAVLGLVSEPIEASVLGAAAIVAAAVVTIGNRLVAPFTRARVGVIGSPFEAARLREELELSAEGGFEVAATITPDDWELDAAALGGPYLASLSQVGRAIDERGLELLVVTQEFPRREVDERLYHEVITRPVRVLNLHEFHELRFGSVPLAEIDYDWFTELAGRHSSRLKTITKRTLDVAIALPALFVFAPVIAIYALVARRGGPPIFRQERVGKGGRPFTLYKLRTMAHAPDQASEWTKSDDERITKAGRLLRGLHLDEAPQFWNIVKGDMSLVGPRPEQVDYVAELTDRIPFYGQRHIVKPGLTGWAQVRLGYSGSVAGTAFKLCNDLYYIKHQSIWLDLAILLETLLTFARHDQFGPPPVTSATMLGEGERRVVDGRLPVAFPSPHARRHGGLSTPRR